MPLAALMARRAGQSRLAEGVEGAEVLPSAPRSTLNRAGSRVSVNGPAQHATTPAWFKVPYYGDQLGREIDKSQNYLRDNSITTGPTASWFKPVQTTHGDSRTEVAKYGGGFYAPAGAFTDGSPPAINLGELPLEAFAQRNNPSPRYAVTRDSIAATPIKLKHESYHAAQADIPRPQLQHRVESAVGEYGGEGSIRHDEHPLEMLNYMSQLQEQRFKDTGSRFETPDQYRDYLKSIPFDEKDGAKFDASVKQQPFDVQRLFRQMRANKLNDPAKFDKILQWQADRMPGIVQNSGDSAVKAAEAKETMSDDFSPATAALLGAIPGLGPTVSSVYTTHKNPDKATYGGVALEALLPMLGGAAGAVGGGVLGSALGAAGGAAVGMATDRDPAFVSAGRGAGGLAGALGGLSAGQSLVAWLLARRKQQQAPLTADEVQQRDRDAPLKASLASILNPMGVGMMMKAYDKDQTASEGVLRGLAPMLAQVVLPIVGPAAAGYLISKGPLERAKVAMVKLANPNTPGFFDGVLDNLKTFYNKQTPDTQNALFGAGVGGGLGLLRGLWNGSPISSALGGAALGGLGGYYLPRFYNQFMAPSLVSYRGGYTGYPDHAESPGYLRPGDDATGAALRAFRRSNSPDNVASAVPQYMRNPRDPNAMRSTPAFAGATYLA